MSETRQRAAEPERARAAAPESVPALMERLDAIAGTLPKRLVQCADFLRRNVHLVPVSTVADLAAGAGVQPSAFMRFCQALGFSGYSEMQALFRTQYRQLRPDYAERLSELRRSGDDEGLGWLVARFAEAGHTSLMEMVNRTDTDSLEAAATILSRARTIHLVGLRRAFAVVSYAGYMLDKMRVPTVIHRTAGQIESDHAIRPGDALFAVTFAPFSAETLELARRTNERGIPVVGLSDTADGPLKEVARTLLLAEEVDVGSFRVPTVALTLATALVVAVGQRRGAGEGEHAKENESGTHDRHADD